MSTNVPGFQSFLGFSHIFVLVKLATSSMRVNTWPKHKHQEADLTSTCSFQNHIPKNTQILKKALSLRVNPTPGVGL